jgi:hypothetical protein
MSASANLEVDSETAQDVLGEGGVLQAGLSATMPSESIADVIAASRQEGARTDDGDDGKRNKGTGKRGKADSEPEEAPKQEVADPLVALRKLLVDIRKE